MRIAPTTVHLWLSDLATPAQQVESCGLAWLSEPELARLPTFGSSHRRQQFLAGHWLLRHLLASIAGGAPADWRLSGASDAAPFVLQAPAGMGGASRYTTALSHSGNWIACAAATTMIGIDVEDATRRRINVESLSHEVLSAAELQRLQAAADRASTLRHAWSLKEAWLKAHGEGVSLTRLPQLHTELATVEHARARLWSTSQWSLALSTPGLQMCDVVVSARLDAPATESNWLIQDLCPAP